MYYNKYSFIAAVLLAGASAFAAHHKSVTKNWPMWGGTPDRNMVAKAKGLVTEVETGDFIRGTEKIDMETTKGVKWVTKLGSITYGTPSIYKGKIYVGTNNESPRDANQTGDRGILMCFDEETGDFNWQLIVPKLGAGKVSDWEFVGLCSSPAINDDRLWVITNRGDVLCLDVNGLADGNDGPFKDEATYMSQSGEPVELTDQHADILWSYDIRSELGVFPHNVSSCSPLYYDGRIYVATSNGVDWSHKNIPAPFAPALAVFDAYTGELVGEEITGVGQRILHANWSPPTIGEVDGKARLFWGGGDGFIYGFDPVPVMDEDEGIPILKEVFRYDANPPEYRTKDGEPIKYATFDGASEFIATIVHSDGLLYGAIGQDPEHGDGVGMLSCLPATAKGDMSGKAKWVNKEIGRSLSTASVHDGLIYQAEYDGDIHCFDAKTGEHYWTYPTRSRVWSSTLVADDKVLLGNEDGELVILKTGKEMEHLATIDFYTPIYCSPVVTNNTIYIATMTHLYALAAE